MAAQPAFDDADDRKQAPGSIRHTIFLNGRDPDRLRLTHDEAWAMHLVGIRFSIFDPINGEYNVSRPHTRIRHLDRDTLTFVQD